MAFKIVLTGSDTLRRVVIRGDAIGCIAALTAAMSKVLNGMNISSERRLQRLSRSTELIAESLIGCKYRCVLEEIKEETDHV